MLSSDASTEHSAATSGEAQFVPLSAEAWRLLVEAEIDTIVRELRKNSLWAEAVERDGLGALWVGGSRWPGTQNSDNACDTEPQAAAGMAAAIKGQQSSESQDLAAKIERYKQEFASRRTLGRAGECIGLASFDDKSDDVDSSGYEMARMMILESFLLLREAINGVSDPHTMDLSTIIDPFLLVVRDPETTGPITRCALVSIQRFISHGIVDLGRAEAVPALLDMTQAVTHCRFEATDAASDEAVLMQILNVLSVLVLSPGGSRLNDVSVCEIMETVLSMSCQMRLSEILRKAAESTLFTLVTFVFGKLNDIGEADVDAKSMASSGSNTGAYDEAAAPEHVPSVTLPVNEQNQVEADPEALDATGNALTEPTRSPRSAAATLETQSFGLPAIRELYRVLVALTNPRDLQYTDTMRLLALNTLQAAFQKACYAMAEHAELRELTLGDLCHNLLLILQRDQPSLISPALRVLYLLFASHRRDTKGQLELFLCQTLGRVMTLPVIARQGSRASLRLGGGSRPPTPKAGAQRVLPKPTLDIKGDAGTKAKGSEMGRRLSAASADTDTGILKLESDTAPTYEQEVELYSDASLKRGMRGRLATNETRRQLLEGLHHLLIGDEALLADLWVNYDCDLQRGNMFDFVVSFVVQRAVPWPGANDAESGAFMDVMLHQLIRMAVRAGVAPPTGRWAQLLGMPATTGFVKSSSSSDANNPDANNPEPSRSEPVLLTLAQLQDRRRHKETMMQAARLFNEKPKDGVAYLHRVGVLNADGSEAAQQLATFLRSTPTINKKLLGEYLSKPSNLEVLQTYMQQLDFSGRRLDEALRTLLGTFRLPGESQQIERIMETFSAAYFGTGPADIATKDAAFILAFAVVMLNTDQHSPQVKVRMKYEDFARNLRGVNDGHDFRTEFLTNVYNAIRSHELVFPEEHEGEAGFEYAWHAVAAPDALIGPWMSTRGCTATYDRGMLAAVWPRYLRSLAHILGHFPSDHTLRLALTGLHALVATAAHYGLTQCVNEAVRLLANMTGLPQTATQADLRSAQVLTKSYNRYMVLDPATPTSPLSAVAEGFSGAEQRAKLQEQEDAAVQVTQTALEFGKTYRGQIAFIALFELVERFAQAINRQGWICVLDVVRACVDADLVPRELRAIRDPTVEELWVPRVSTLRAMYAAEQRVRAGDEQRVQQGGLLSAISSFWGGSGDQQPSGRQELRWRATPEVLAGLVARSHMAVRSSAIGELGSAVSQIGESLPVFLDVLAQLFPQPPPSQPGSPADATPQSDMVPAPIDSGSKNGAEYVPSAVYFFEIAVGLVLDAPDCAPIVWPAIEASVQRMLESADTIHPFALERTVASILTMATRILESCTGHTPHQETVERMLRCLGLLRDSREQTFARVARVLSDGIARLVNTDAHMVVSVYNNWGIVRLLLKRLALVQDGCVRGAVGVFVEVVVLMRCGAVDVGAYYEDLLDTMAAFVPSDRALATTRDDAGATRDDAGATRDDVPSHMSGSEAASKLIALLYDMQDIAKAQAADAALRADSATRPSDHMHSPSTSPTTTTRHLQPEPSITSATSLPPALRSHRTTPLSMWIGAMNALATYACLSSRNVRQLACSHIQRAVSGLDVQWVYGAFGRVLFPLMDTLLRADLLADSAMEDTHARCISMLTMVFLHNASALQNAEDCVALTMSPSLGSSYLLPTSDSTDAVENVPESLLSHVWIRLIRTLAVYIRTGKMADEARVDAQSPSEHGVPMTDTKRSHERRRHLSVLSEMAEESVKNCMLVLDSMGIFGRSDAEREMCLLWQKSWDCLSKISPQLRQYIFPQASVVSEEPAADMGDKQAATGEVQGELRVDDLKISDTHEPDVDASGPTTDDTHAIGANADGPRETEQPEPLSPVEPKKKRHSKQSIIIVP
ncbi:GDP/GTP exchange factor for ARF [Coemansia sp. RSA 562]|nr:GDP/GTP exchange factor for ARF [Coemansia sp. RSA 562]KAJ2250939.1 GDP/GTP exchange factor for ARF [Coemansia sp. RSA 475]KAJ2293803.1 GDP/GTP exchange factor for ARF [Coemansia sp. RSA 355]KAJ2410864.1 GDP/GTP exchange factor for ARF [Coemansia sp. RSA 2526]